MEEEIELTSESRNSLHKLAMAAIYDFLTYRSMGQPFNVEETISGLCGLPYEECDYFIKACVIMAVKYQEEAIAKFNANMRKWTFDRLNRVEQAILILTYVHYLYVDPEVDKGVVIDIAVRLSKTYLSDNDYKFVNAILDRTLNDAR